VKSKSKNKTTQQGTQTQTSTGNTTAASQAYEQGIGQAFNTAAPEIGYSAAARHQRVDEGYDNPWSMNDSPEVREAQSYTRHSNIDQETGQLYKEDAARRREAKVGHQGALAGLLASNTTTGSSTGSGTFVGEQTQPWGPALIGAVGTAAGGFLG
jgi:hypothetical protein